MGTSLNTATAHPLEIILSVVVSAFSVGLAFFPWPFWDPADPNKLSTIVRGAILALWAVGPPLWFMYEYYRFDDWDKFERLKYSQDLASKLWAGMVVALTILYFGKDILHK